MSSKMILRCVVPNTQYQVQSGEKTYTVVHLSGDRSERKGWECTCPGHRYRGDCKHVRFVLDVCTGKDAG